MIKRNVVSIYCNNLIDVIKINEIVGTSYNREHQVFAIYLKDYTFEYSIDDFLDRKDFINTINTVNRLIREYGEE